MWTLGSTHTFDACIDKALEKEIRRCHFTYRKLRLIKSDPRNLSEFSLESNSLGFNYPRIHCSSPDVTGCCLPQTVLARNLVVPYHMEGLFLWWRRGAPLPGAGISGVWACGLPEEVSERSCPHGSTTTHPCHSAAGPGPAQVIYIIAQQQAGPVLRATLAHREQIASGALGSGALGCALAPLLHQGEAPLQQFVGGRGGGGGAEGLVLCFGLVLEGGVLFFLSSVTCWACMTGRGGLPCLTRRGVPSVESELLHNSPTEAASEAADAWVTP